MGKVISQLVINGVTYELKDTAARNAASAGLQYVVVQSLPAAPSSASAAAEYQGKFYLVPHIHANDTASSDKNTYDEYVLVEVTNGAAWRWEKIGSTDVDLSDYSKRTHTHKVTLNVGLTGASYTPAGSVSTPTITVTPATTKLKGITGVGSLPELSYEAGTVDGSKITAFDGGSVATSEEKTVVSGVSSATTTANNFTASVSGETLTLSSSAGSVTVTPSTTKVNSMVSGGSVATLTYGAASVNASKVTSFSKGSLPTQSAETTLVTGITSATSSQPTFNGTAATITPTLTGNQATLTTQSDKGLDNEMEDGYVKGFEFEDCLVYATYHAQTTSDPMTYTVDTVANLHDLLMQEVSVLGANTKVKVSTMDGYWTVVKVNKPDMV